MKRLLTAAMAVAISGSRLFASPIEWVVESQDDLNDLGAKIQIIFTPGKELGDHGTASFEVDWTGEKQTPDIHYRMLNLLISDSKHPNQYAPVGTRFTIKLGDSRNRDLPIRAEFRASEAELESTVLAFWQGGANEVGWETVHYLVLKRVVDKFPEQDPFAELPDSNKANKPIPRKPSD